MAKVDATITPASVAANTMIDQAFAIPGFKAGDFVGLTPPSLVPAAGVYKLLIVR